MPPSIGILVGQLELVKSDNGVLIGLVTKWSTFEVTIFNVDVIVVLRVVHS